MKKTQQLEITHGLAKLPPNHYQYKKDSIREVTRNGLRYHLDLSDFVQWRTFWGILDVGKDRLFSLLQPGNLFLDVGANIGEICLHATKQVGENGKVLAFEPIPLNQQNLRRNISLNPALAERIELFPFALGEKDEEEVAFIHPRKDNQGMIRVQPLHDKKEVFETVSMRSLDSFLTEKGVTRLDGIKIDVEGYELKVLKGGRESITQFHPWLYLELDDSNLRAQGDSAQALVTFLASIGYLIQDAATEKTITSNDSFYASHFDVIAFFKTK